MITDICGFLWSFHYKSCEQLLFKDTTLKSKFSYLIFSNVCIYVIEDYEEIGMISYKKLLQNTFLYELESFLNHG